MGATFTAIQGPLNFTFGEFKVAPRDETDLEGYVEAPPPPPPMGFGDCATMPEMDACMMSELCVVDDPGMPTVAVCTELGCAVAADCPPAPPGGDAPVECGDINGDGMPADCFLDCSGGQTCPTGMDCFMSFICVWPA